MAKGRTDKPHGWYYQRLIKQGRTYQRAKEAMHPLYTGPGPEAWRILPGIDGDVFEVSNKGRIRRARDKKLCFNAVNHSGYSITSLPGATPKTVGTANAVWRAWVPWITVGRGTGLELDHINGKKHDCRLCNLRPVPRRINCSKNGTPVQIGDVIYPCMSEAARALGVEQPTIRAWLHKGCDTKGNAVVSPPKKYVDLLLGRTVRL